ncbi:MAG: sulfite exporter TauE/SafE family protein, partial [Alphaproteobacteria bacterium]|nr:sulfite exporter TauE/SafE family protein [Alphaproteobacteria bacterium]
MDWANTLSGLIVGLLIGMTGVGGGSLMAPLLIFFGYPPMTAVGTDLWFAGLTKCFGGYVHHRQGSVDRQVLRRLLIGSIPAAIVTLLIMRWIGAAQIKKGVMLNALGVVLILTAFATLFRTHLVRWSHHYQRAHGHDAPLNVQTPLTILAGMFLGTMVTLTSVGAGALGVTLVYALYPLRMKTAILVATDIMHAIPLTLIAGIGYMLLGAPVRPVPGHFMLGNVDATL